MEDNATQAPEAVASVSVAESTTPEVTPEGQQPSAESPESGQPAKAETADDIAQKIKQERGKERFARLHAESKQFQAEAAQARLETQRLKQELAKIQERAADPLHADDASNQYRSAVKEERLEQRAADAEMLEQRAGQARAQAFHARVEAARDRMPDFDQVFAKTPITTIAAELISESEKAVEIVYWLGKNPAEAVRIYDLPPHQQGAEIARIENRISTVSTRKNSNAPNPPPVLNGQSAPGAKDINSMSMPEYAEFRKKQEQGKSARR